MPHFLHILFFVLKVFRSYTYFLEKLWFNLVWSLGFYETFQLKFVSYHNLDFISKNIFYILITYTEKISLKNFLRPLATFEQS